ncbi:MAG: DNA internalization-related competence protein ComEC/Rec2 [SAR202 cluster bacterium]|nr:DNA internalization-related competence protein ComEC/Rec2 [SAR202 cluster bacterium]
MVLLTIAAAFLTGIFAGAQSGVHPVAIAALITASIPLGFMLRRLRRGLLRAALVVAIALGSGRVEAFGDGRAPSLLRHECAPRAAEGVIVSDPEPAGSATRFRVAVDSVHVCGEWRQAGGDALVTARPSAELVLHRDAPYFRYGDRVLLDGELEAPPTLGGFDYATFLDRQGITAVVSFPRVDLLGEGRGQPVYQALFPLRRSLAESLERLMPEPEASLAVALLLGIRSSMPADTVQEFRDTGTAHIIAISGMHIALILVLSLAVSRWALGRRGHYYLLPPLLLVWSYSMLAGLSPSVARAAIMGTVYLAAYALGRPRTILPALGGAAAIMAALDPMVLWSVSFQLSFAAMAGIAVIATPLAGALKASLIGEQAEGEPPTNLASLSIDAVAATVAATITTVPLSIFYFEKFSVVGVLANIAILPALTIQLLAQAVAAVIGIIAPALAAPFGWLAWVTTAYLTGVAALFSRLPFAALDTIGIPGWAVALYYAALSVGYVAFRLRLIRFARWTAPALPRLRLRVALPGGVHAGVMVPLAAVCSLLFVAVLSDRDGRLHVAFFDVGQGDEALITTPSGLHILVDGGPSPSAAVQHIGRRMPFWKRHIDMVILTHAHADHVAGLVEVLERYQVRHVLQREVFYESPDYLAWRKAADLEGAQLTRAVAGQVVHLGDGVSLEVVSPGEELFLKSDSDIDNASVVFRLVYGESSFLFTGDMFHEAERDVLSAGLNVDSDIIKVAHHGSRTSSTEAFLEAVSPQAAVISAGASNRYGHPNPGTLEKLARLMPPGSIYQTAERGTIEFTTDGKRMWVRTER